MTIYCLVCGKVQSVSGGIGMLLDHAYWCRCGGVTALKERLAEAERLLRITLKTTLCTYDEPDLRDMIYAFLEGGK